MRLNRLIFRNEQVHWFMRVRAGMLSCLVKRALDPPRLRDRLSPHLRQLENLS